MALYPYAAPERSLRRWMVVQWLGVDTKFKRSVRFRSGCSELSNRPRISLA